MFELYAMDPEFAEHYFQTLAEATATERATALDRFGKSPGLPPILSVSSDGESAGIAIKGVLSPTGPGPLARLFGFDGTAYNDIAAAAETIAATPSIKTVRLQFDTPGGSVSGMDQARQAISKMVNAGKEVIAENHGMMASAGYHLATAAPKIVAMSPMAVTGSIGVIMAGRDFTGAEAKMGIKRIRIVSKNAPNKQPDPGTDSGIKVLQEQVDAMERVFIQAVADGRNTTTKDVIENYGKGGILIAQDPDPKKADALSVGMIDAVQNNGNSAVVNGGGAGSQASENVDQQEGPSMDLNQLKAEHPALFAQVVEIGANQERERSEAHITLGEASGDMAYALACVKDGSAVSSLVTAKHTAAGIKNQAIGARGEEAPGKMTPGASDDDNGTDREKQIAAVAAELMGVQING